MAAAAVAVPSASGLLSLLDEDDESLRLYALQSLNKIVHEFWFQIASQQAIASVEAFYEDEEFSHRELAALVASKASTTLPPQPHVDTTVCHAWPVFVCWQSSAWRIQVFYHLGELDQALTYALGAGKLFDISEQTEYVSTILCTQNSLLPAFDDGPAANLGFMSCSTLCGSLPGAKKSGSCFRAVTHN